MRRTPLLALVIPLVAAAALLAGCGSSATSGTRASTTTAPDFATGTAPADSVSFRPVLEAPADVTALPTVDQLGPVALDGDGIVRLSVVSSSGAFVINPVLAQGPAGIDAFNAAAAACYAKAPTCPTGQIAFVLDGAVVMAPTVTEASYEADQIQISGNWTREQAEDVARRISAAAHG